MVSDVCQALVGGSGGLDALEKAKVPKKFDSTFACVNLKPEVFAKTVNGKATKEVRPGGRAWFAEVYQYMYTLAASSSLAKNTFPLPLN